MRLRRKNRPEDVGPLDALLRRPGPIPQAPLDPSGRRIRDGTVLSREHGERIVAVQGGLPDSGVGLITRFCCESF
jgi:hypothetical protein